MTINFNYDKNFTSNYVDKQTEESPFISMLNIGYKSIVFAKLLLQNYPELFGDEAAAIFYIENAGKTIKPELLYLAFENYLTNSTTNIIKAKLNNVPLYTVNQDNIIQWARYIQNKEKFVIFEPVMHNCNNVLKTFINCGKKFVYKNYDLDIEKIKPLCVNNVGENCAELMIYVAYLYNFFINCKPFVFNEVITGSSAQLFMEAINNHFNVYFTKLINEGTYTKKNSKTITNDFRFNSLDQLFADVKNIEYFKASEVKTILKNMLDISKILDIRDRVLNKNDELLNISMSNQNTVSMDVCYKGFISVFSVLFDKVVKLNYWYKNIFINLPRFNENNINYHELSLMTEYAICGGDHPFVINEYEQYEASGDPGSLFKYPNIGLQTLKTNIFKPSITTIKPFASSNVFAELITGFLAQLLEEYQTDVFNHPPIKVDEKDLDLVENKKANIRIEQILNNLYINGKYSLYSSSVCNSLNYLMKNKEFKDGFNSIFKLCNIFDIIYDNKFASKMISAYILSFFPEYLNTYLHNNNSGSLDKFNYVLYFCLQHKNINQKRVNKLHDMLMSIMYMFNNDYIKFVNKNAGKLTKILNLNTYIVQPYMKTVQTKIDMYAIGGISLGMKCIDTNPLSRGFYYVVSTQGNSENINEFYEFAKNIPSGDIFDLLNNAIKEKNDVYVKQLINSAYNNMFENGLLPKTLLNFSIDSDTGKYHRLTHNYFANLETSNNIPIYKLISNYSFPVISATNEQQPIFYSRSITLNKQVSRPYENNIKFGNQVYTATTTDRGTEYVLPQYDFSTMFKTVNLSFIQPNGFKLMQIYTPNGEIAKNNMFFVFTKASTIDDDTRTQKYNVYDSLNNNAGISTNGSNIFTTNLSSPEVSIRRVNNVPHTPNDTFKTNRIQLKGVDRQPISNGAHPV